MLTHLRSLKPLHYILFIAAVLRLQNVDAPIIGVHSWRQADTAAMARNFAEGGMNLLYPQVDWGGNTAGYVESEFPLYQYLVAAIYLVLGADEIWARLISVLASLVGIYFFHALTRRILGTRVAIWATLFYALLPLNVFYGRTVMPESFMLMFSVMGIYYFSRWVDGEGGPYFFGSVVAISLAALLKLPALYLGLPLAYLAWSRFGRGFLRIPAMWGYAIIVFASVGLWYYHAHQILLNGGLTFGIWEYSDDKWGNWDLVLSFNFWNRIIFQSLAERHLTWLGVPLVILGLLKKRETAKEGVFDFWLLAVFIYTVIVARGNFVHEYYQLPAMIPLAVFMGKYVASVDWSFAAYPKKNVMVLVLLLGVLGLGTWRYADYLSHENEATSTELALATRIQEATPRGALLGIIDNGDPTILYLAKRKGWHLRADTLTGEGLNRLSRFGMGYFAGARSFVDESQWPGIESLFHDFRPVLNDGKVFIVSVEPS